ncbi:MAG: zinc-binding dehydrogenase [Coriobacteriia bacterium]|nr:zinc-binding dehydrogenase [Coriobacteriia bacterium]
MFYAQAITSLGGPDVISRIALDEPELDDGQVLIEVQATSYNNIDAILRKEDFGLPFPIVPGTDVVGRIVSGSQLGQRVIVNPSIPCGECNKCLSGGLCEYVHILGVNCPGGYGRFIKVPANQCYPLPENIPTEIAAAAPLTFLTAWRMLNTKACVARGDRVVIWGATGALGSTAISLVRHLGGVPIAVVRSKKFIDRLINHGAEYVVLADEVEQMVNELTDGSGAEVVFEGPGTPTWITSLRMLAQGGRLVTAGVTGGKDGVTDIEDLYYKQVTIFGSRMGYQHEFEEAISLLISGAAKPLIDSVMPIAQAQKVHEIVERGDRCGKIVMLHE